MEIFALAMPVCRPTCCRFDCGHVEQMAWCSAVVCKPIGGTFYLGQVSQALLRLAWLGVAGGMEFSMPLLASGMV